MTPLEVIRASESEGARVYLGADGTARLRGECSAEAKAALRAVRDELPAVLVRLERAAWLCMSVRRTSAEVGQREVPAALGARWREAAAGYAASGSGWDSVRAAEAAIVAALGAAAPGPEHAAVAPE